MLRYQNPSGTTLRPVRSLASHCTRKRPANSACPSRPIVTQTVSVVMWESIAFMSV